MKNKKAVVIVAVLIIIVLIVGIAIAAVKKKSMKNDNPTYPGVFKISYSYGGSWGLEHQAAMRTISVDQTGFVTINLADEKMEVVPMMYEIGKEKAKELIKYYVDNDFQNMKEDLSDNGLMDGNTYYLEISSSTINRKVGGYGSNTNEKFNGFIKKFREIIDEDALSKFDKNVERAYNNKEEKE